MFGGTIIEPALPLVAPRLLALGPHEAVALAGQDDHVRAGAVAVALLVRGGRELRDVAVHRALGHGEADVPAAGAALLGLDQRQVDRVGDEVRVEQQALLLALGREVVRLAVEALREVVGRAEDEVDVVVEVDDRRGVGRRDEPRDLGARAVEVLVVGVQRDGEQRARAPLEGDLGAGVVPHLGGAVAGEDQDHAPRTAGAAGRARRRPGSRRRSSRSTCGVASWLMKTPRPPRRSHGLSSTVLRSGT